MASESVVATGAVIQEKEEVLIGSLRKLVEKKEKLTDAHRDFLTDLTYVRFLRTRTSLPPLNHKSVRR